MKYVWFLILIVGCGRLAQQNNSVDDCPLEGNATRDKEKALNALKNRTAFPTVVDRMSLADFLTPGDDTGRFDESHAASLEACVVRVKPGGVETCNCDASALEDRDTHIELGETFDAKPNQVVIVEVTPRVRKLVKDDWSTEMLTKTLKGKRVRVEGWLLWDVEHVGSAENTNPGGANNWRATCWEIHPITRIEVLDGVACNLGSVDDVLVVRWMLLGIRPGKTVSAR